MTSTGDARSSSVAIQFLQRFLRDRDEGRTRTLAEYQSLFASQPDVVAAEYAALMADTKGAADEGPLAHAARGDRYRESKMIGRGAMGTVLRVFDPALQREVAMKRLSGPDGKLPDAHLLGRFLDEAKITGQLQHPGIVSVFEIGLDDRHRPYFTMPLIEGRSLYRVIEDLHAGAGDWSQLRTLDALVRICEAMAYAHERGVVHRDLKPANVMVGRFGETYVVDWGLARASNQPDRRDIRIRDAGDNDRGGADSALRTMEGDVIGTPAYMAPEQARGEIDAIDRSSDVYSLGAMLYHLLTGTAPYLDSNRESNGRETLHRVIAGPPERIGKLAPTVAPELVAICERAMARQKAERYASAAAMGDDLRAFLENRVVSAYATGPFAELRQWVRRNRALAVASLVALVALIGGFAWSETQRHQADANATLASENLDLAFEAGEELFDDLGLRGLGTTSADPLREALIMKALAYYQRLRDLRGDDPRVDRQIAKARFRIADLHSLLGHAAEARAAWREARTATEYLIARDGETPQLRHRLVKIKLEQQIQAMQTGDIASAIPNLEAAAEALREMRAGTPESTTLLRDSLYTTFNIAIAMIETRNQPGALRYTNETLETARELVRGAPDDPVRISLLGAAFTLRGKLAWQLGRLDEAATFYDAGTRLLETALTANPDHRGLRSKLGELLNLHGVLLRQQGRLAEAETMFARTADIYRGLVMAYPGVRNYHGSFGGALCNVGIVMSAQGRAEEALPIVLEAREQLDRALDIDPTALDFRHSRRNVAVELTAIHFDHGRHEEAAEEARAVMRRVPDENQHIFGQVLADCVRYCLEDPSLSPTRCAELAKTYGDEAMALLQQAARQKTIDLAGLERPAFDGIRDRPDFAELIQKLGQ